MTSPRRRRAALAVLATAAAVPALASPWGVPFYVTGLVLLLLVLAARPLVRADGRGTWGAFAVGAALLTATQLVRLVTSSGASTVTPVELHHRQALAVLSLSAYPFLYARQMGLLRRRVRELLPSAWLDGILMMVSLTAVAAAALIGPVVAATGLGRLGALAVVGRPSMDLLVFSVAVTTCAILRRRSGRRAVLLVAAFGSLTAADVVGVLRFCGVLDQPHLLLLVDGGHLLAFSLIAVAAWSCGRDGATDAVPGWSSMLTPLIVLVTSCTLLAVDHVHRLPSPTAQLALLGLLGVGVKGVVLFREVLRLADSRRLALTDDLTGLPNRRALAAALERAVADDVPAALLLLDLDRFKEVNDSHGHAQGDLLLRATADRMRQVVPPGALLARVGGDEFALLLPGADQDEAERLAEGVGALLGAPVQVGLRWTASPSSTGIACWPAGGETLPDPAGELLRRADTAMYVAKRRGGGHAVYDDAADRVARAQRLLVEELTTGIEAGELVAHYQPQVDVATGRAVGMEALVRWNHPRLGTLAPAAFLDLAEAHGLMGRITEVVLRQATRQAVTWRRHGHPLRVSVNLSTSCLMDPALPHLVANVVQERGLDPSTLVLEITETTLMDDPGRSRETIEDLLLLGTSVSIDDYGTGYSSLAYLQDLPASELKLDRAFTTRLTGDPRTAAIIASTADLAHSLGLRMLVEGVEDATTLDQLAALGVDETQGYHHARPTPAADVLSWLAGHSPVPATAGRRGVGRLGR